MLYRKGTLSALLRRQDRVGVGGPVVPQPPKHLCRDCRLPRMPFSRTGNHCGGPIDLGSNPNAVLTQGMTPDKRQPCRPPVSSAI